MKKKYGVMILVSCVVLLIILAAALFLPDPQVARFLKEFEKYPGANEFLTANPDFAKSIARSPEIATFFRNSLDVNPKFTEFIFKNYTKIIADLKNDSIARKNFLSLSTYQASTMLTMRNYDKLMSFYKECPHLAGALQDRDFAYYMAVEHPEKMSHVLSSLDRCAAAIAVWGHFEKEKNSK